MHMYNYLEVTTFSLAAALIVTTCYFGHTHCNFSLQAFPRNLGEKQTWLVKIFAGGLVLIGLVVLIWLPLLLISIIGTASEPNPPVQVDIKLSIGGFQVCYVIPNTMMLYYLMQ